MNILDRYISPQRLVILSFVLALFIVYPNIACLPWELNHMPASEHLSHILYFCYRYVYFVLFIFTIQYFNLYKFWTPSLGKRFWLSLLITFVAYGIYVLISLSASKHGDCFTSILLFQFAVVGIISTFLGHLSIMYNEQLNREKEIENLRYESLRSRCDALTNQINPHFFFNSLNGLISLIRKKNEEEALKYVDKLSDVFRYILQSDKKGLVTLGEELEFVRAFSFMMEVRFANKLEFRIDVPREKRNLKLPVLTLLPLIDNIVVHNTIDSDHKMEALIMLNSDLELVVSNPVYPKLEAPDTNGTGLNNLESRFHLMMDRRIRIENDSKVFSVYLPLKEL